MAATKVTKRSVISFKLVVGTDDAGKNIIRTISLPQVVASPDLDSVVAIKGAAAQCLAYPISQTEHAYTSIINEA
ncbi:MAG: hypothetical protein IJ667_12345 [Synergistaceae bacterium]|nr:hypothetical protein [Synergistaceae bacterium]